MRRYLVHIAYKALGVVGWEYHHRAVAVAEFLESAGKAGLHFRGTHAELLLAVVVAVVADGAVQQLYAVIQGNVGRHIKAVACSVVKDYVFKTTLAVLGLPSAALDVALYAFGVLLYEVSVGRYQVLVEDAVFGVLLFFLHLVASARCEDCG